jgi:hypothetical protein
VIAQPSVTEPPHGWLALAWWGSDAAENGPHIAELLIGAM